MLNVEDIYSALWMDRLLAFLKSNIHHLLFVLLEVVALLLLFRKNRYNRTVLVSTRIGFLVNSPSMRV